MQIVPGHRDGENRNAQIAKREQPRPRPALCWLRRDEGRAKKIAATEEAIERVLNAIAVGVMGGDVERSPEDTMVRIAITMPAASVMFPSVGQDTRGDVATSDQGGLDVAVGVSAVPCELEAAREGRGEGKRSTEHAKARYPVTRSENAALNVIPEKSSNAASTTTKTEAVRVFKVCAQPLSDGLSAVSVFVTLEVIATSRTSPVRKPPIWVAA